MEAVSKRKSRVEAMKAALERTSGSSLKKARAVISLSLGLTPKKIDEYLMIFQDAEYISVEGDIFTWLG